MANFRQIHVSIWKDNWFLDLDPQEKLLFIYFFGNELASLAGIYKIPLKVVAFETCLDIQTVKDTLSKFENDGKIFYRDGIVWVRNLRKYNGSASPKVKARIDSDLKDIPDIPLKTHYLAYYNGGIPYPYCMDTLSYEEKTKEENTNEDNPAHILSDTFVNETGIMAHSLEKWTKALRDLDELKATPEDIKTAINELGDDYTIIGLWSIVNAVRNVIRKRKRSNPVMPGKTDAQDFMDEWEKERVNGT